MAFSKILTLRCGEVTFSSTMDVEFDDNALALIETGQAGEIKLPLAVVNSARRKLLLIRAAPDERTLRSWKSLHYEKLVGDRQGDRSIRLNDKWRMVLRLDDTCSPAKVVVLSIENHYE
jgi:proteic killer suppression protein